MLLLSIFGALLVSVAAQVPSWPANYSLSGSSIVMPCNDSGFFDASIVSKFAVVDFDWSNAKQLYVNSAPMNCEELLIEQAALIKAVSPNTRIWVYRNLVKALPWYTDVQVKINDPAYAGWFLPFSGTGNYHVPTCDNNWDPPRCSNLYHDQDQTPQHPHGDGSCTSPCDCGGVPCGEYLWVGCVSFLGDLEGGKETWGFVICLHV
jgi:hypothetical protein